MENSVDDDFMDMPPPFSPVDWDEMEELNPKRGHLVQDRYERVTQYSFERASTDMASSYGSTIDSAYASASSSRPASLSSLASSLTSSSELAGLPSLACSTAVISKSANQPSSTTPFSKPLGWISMQPKTRALVPAPNRSRRQRGRVAALTAEQRSHAAVMRLIGSCSNCKMRKEKCDSGSPCKSCREYYKDDLVNHPCSRPRKPTVPPIESIGNPTNSMPFKYSKAIDSALLSGTKKGPIQNERDGDKDFLDQGRGYKKTSALESAASIGRSTIEHGYRNAVIMTEPTSPLMCWDETSSTRDQREMTASSSDSSGESELWSEASSMDSESTTLTHGLDSQVKDAARLLLREFAAWRKIPRQHGNEPDNDSTNRISQPCDDSENPRTSPAEHQSWQNANSNRFSKKRSADEEEEEQDQPRQRPKPSRSTEHAESKILACPFAKNNPFKHRSCFKYMIQEISRLKQHLLRVHKIPVHCPKCFEVFRSEDNRDSHIRELPGCVVTPSRTWDGISESQKRQLAKRVSSKKSREENWYLIYGILFPSAARPESPYVDNTHLAEELLALREFASRVAPVRIFEFAQTNFPLELRQSRAQIEHFTQAAVQNVFDSVIEGWLAQRASQNPSIAPPETDSGYLSVESSMSNSSGSPSQQQLSRTNAPASNEDNPPVSQTNTTEPVVSADGFASQLALSNQPPGEIQLSDPYPSQLMADDTSWFSSGDPFDLDGFSTTNMFNSDSATWN